ncbi:MAG: hypothetical protein JKY54_11700 [Flavobacteriales bacterium]|nr:hypothetical protein [Flavobacteriales bacterium]
MNIGICLIHNAQQDSAEYYFKQAINVANEKGTQTDKLKAYTYLGVFYQENNRPKKAIQTLKQGEEYINSNSPFTTKALLYEGLALSYSSTKNFKEAYESEKKNKRYNDSIQLTGYKEQIFITSYLNKLHALEKEKEILFLEKEILNQKHVYDTKISKGRIIGVVLLSILIVLALLLIVFRINKRKKIIHIEAINERLEKEHIKKSSKIELLKRENALLAAETKFSIQKDEVNDIKVKLEEHIDKSSDPEFNSLRIFLKKLKNVHKNEKNLKHIDATLDYENGQFFSLLRKKHANLTTDDIRLCALLRLNISTIDLASIFNISPESLRKKKYRLKKKLKLQKDTSLENYIASL